MDARIDIAPIRCTNCHFFELSFSSSSDNCRVIINIPNKCIVTWLLPLWRPEKLQIRESGDVSDAPLLGRKTS